MAKKTKNQAAALTQLKDYERDLLRVLLQRRELANIEVRNYLIQILTVRGLDPQKWGVTPDLSSFTEIPQPPAQPQAPAQAAPATAAPATDAAQAATPAPEANATAAAPAEQASATAGATT